MYRSIIRTRHTIRPVSAAKAAMAAEPCTTEWVRFLTLTGLSPTQVAKRCATCHDGVQTVSVNGVATVAPLTNSFSDYSTSVHALGSDFTGARLEADHGAPCVRCHTNEGAILADQSGFTGSLNTLNQTNNPAPVWGGDYTKIQCDTCHQHGGGVRVVKSRDINGNVTLWNPDKSAKADQFNLCTSCHGLIDNDAKTILASGDTFSYNSANVTTGGVTTTYPGQTLATNPAGHHNTTWYHVIATTHANIADNVDATSGANFGITGYIVRKSGDSPCFDCHGHEARTGTDSFASSANTTTSYTPGGGTTPYFASSSASIYTDWAQSAHAGFLFSEKINVAQTSTATKGALVDAVMAAATTDGALSSDHDWSATSSQACQRCHTATGSSNFLNGPTKYDQTANSFTDLAGWSTSTPASNQRELIYCWSCHTKASSGVVRNPGAITVPTSDYTYGGNAVVFPDADNSNTCIACHSGRGNSDTITNLQHSGTNYSGAVGHGSVAHHGSAASTVYSAVSHVGYEFPSLSYVKTTDISLMTRSARQPRPVPAPAVHVLAAIWAIQVFTARQVIHLKP